MQFLIDTQNISHERLNDEVIIINLASAAYYSGSGTASDLWTLDLPRRFDRRSGEGSRVGLQVR